MVSIFLDSYYKAKLFEMTIAKIKNIDAIVLSYVNKLCQLMGRQI
jgi:hypothetical protein